VQVCAIVFTIRDIGNFCVAGQTFGSQEEEEEQGWVLEPSLVGLIAILSGNSNDVSLLR
jgi:hypothetical protein